VNESPVFMKPDTIFFKNLSSMIHIVVVEREGGKLAPLNVG
jgi:hypothetical protein